MKVYDGSAWLAAYASLSGALLVANNLSDLNNASASRTNLGLAIGTNVQAYSAILAATTASYTTALNSKLSGIEASADVTDTTNVVAALTAGTNIAIAGNGTISATDTNTTYSAGTGISLTGTTFANTAPDQTVAITAGTNVTVTGTYPNFTVAASGGATDINGLTDGYAVAGSLGLGSGSLENDDGTSNYNTGVGYRAGRATTSGTSNVFAGNEPGRYNTTGNSNVAIGQTTAFRGTTGSWNVSMGTLVRLLPQEPTTSSGVIKLVRLLPRVVITWC